MVAQIRPGMAGVQMLQADPETKDIKQGMAIAEAGNAITSNSLQVMNYLKQINQDQNTADMSIAHSKRVQDIQSREYVSSSEAIEMGAKDSPELWGSDDTGEKVEKQVAVSDILPELVKDSYDKLTAQYGENIAGSGARQSWINRRKMQGEEMYTQMAAERNSKVFQKTVEKWEYAAGEAARSGDYGLSLKMWQNHPAPDTIDLAEKENEVFQTMELNAAYQAVQSDDIGMIDHLIGIYSDKDNGSKLEESQQYGVLNMLQSRKSSLEASSKWDEDIQEGMAQYSVVLNNPKSTTSDIRAALHNLELVKVSKGKPEYNGKGFMMEQLGKITKLEGIEVRKKDAWNGINEGISHYSLLEADEKKFVDQQAEETIAAAFETGDENVITQTLDAVSSLASEENVIFPVLGQMISDINAPGASAAEIVWGSTVMGQLQAKGNAALLGSMNPNDTAMALSVYYRVQAGGDPVQVKQDMQANIQNTDEYTREKRGTDFDSKFMDEKQINRSVFEDKWKDQDWGLAVKFLPGFRSPPPPDTMANKFDQLTRDFMVQGFPPNVAQETAWMNVAHIWQPTEVNGQTQWIKGAPEYNYGVSTNAVKAGLSDYLRETFHLDDKSIEGVTISAPIGASMSRTPYYHLQKLNALGVPETLLDSDYNIVIWQPTAQNLQAIDERMKQAEVLKPAEVPRLPASLGSMTGEEARKEKEGKRVAKEEELKREEASRIRMIDDRSKEISESRYRQGLAEDMTVE